jgi:demethylmenaquinone methyltransferase / 2-methoxy-6-polyprenyl-1,4-benzoquinol methylase
MSGYSKQQEEAYPFREEVVKSVIDYVGFPDGSTGLDAGCGIGKQVMLLAEKVGACGHVTGVDLSDEFLSCAGNLAQDSGLSERTSFKKADITRLPFEDGSFDWAWSMDCAGYAPLDPVPIIKELARVVRPGGTVAIAAWSSQKLLPGYPVLEARLDATSSGMAPFDKSKKPQEHFTRALNWFKKAGLKDVGAKTFTGEVHAPLTSDMRKAMESLIDMRWQGVESELNSDDNKEYLRLCKPDSPDYILNSDDYYSFFTYSLFTGKV